MEILKKYGIADAGKDYTWFDLESFEESDSYIKLINNLAIISKNKFAPQNLTVGNEGWTENRTHYISEINFEINDNQYNMRLLCEKWFDFDLILELNKIMMQEGIKEQFYPIRTDDQSLIIVFGDTLLKEKLASENVLENTDQLILEKPLNFNSLKIV
ncbi:hypothetical protein ASG22_00895 [Chryseobacterium sp. Leaf405]|uniref:hypothetical protein n=1 Tax=Chryseobacterium sp. Leaf405 TaxID=1736367 RepID=UPI0006F725F2|nr:hypothetical protein [Chryseobacterium sp. Leaf405]KQT35613.1 hypothetical protein ASG22_00895 [Chryseobacterium sp. Leaf405]